MGVEKNSVKATTTGKKFEVSAKLLNRFFEAKVEENETSIAIIFDDLKKTKKLSFDELNARSNCIANHILKVVKDNNLPANKDGDWIVAICMRPSIDLITAMLAIWKAGAGYLPIDVDFPGVRIQHILDEARPMMVFHDDDFTRADIFHDVTAFNFREFAKLSENECKQNIPDEATLTKGVRNMALFMYTSGSTGKPKGVRLPNVTAQLRLEWQWNEFPFADSETFCLLKSSITFIDHFGEIWNPLLDGRTLVVIPKEFTPNPEKLVPILEKYRIERIIAVPTLIRGLILYVSMLDEASRLPNLKLWMNSGEELTHALAEEFFECFSDGRRILSTFYGATEVMGDVLTFEMTSKADLLKFERIPIGRPTFNTRVYILDENSKPVKTGEVGNIFISGDLISAGYINSSETDVFSRNHLSADPTFGRLYRMGDVGCIRDGLVFYHGRKDTQVKVHGHRVELNEIQNIIDRMSFVEKAAVRVYNRGLEDQKILAFMKLKLSHVATTSADIYNELITLMPKHMIPDVVLIEDMPFLTSGKVDVHKLMSIYENLVNTQSKDLCDFTGIPEKSIEKARVVFKVVASSIGKSCKKLSKNSNFYTVGGNSLNTILCVCHLRDSKYGISVDDFLKATSIGQIIDKLVNINDKIPPMVLPESLNWLLQPLSKEIMNECVEIIAKAFVEKDEITQLLEGITVEHFSDYYRKNWDFLIEKNLSFIVRDSHHRIVGVSLNYEAGNEPPFESIHENYRSLVDFFDFIEADFLALSSTFKLKVFETLELAASSFLSSAENVNIFGFMEENILKIAQKGKFDAVFTTNTSELTLQLDEMVFGYRKLKEFQVNRYVDKSGKRLFEKAGNSVKCVTMWKSLKKIKFSCNF